MIVVSEERGEVSLVHRGGLSENLDRAGLKARITQTLQATPEPDALSDPAAEAQSA